MATAGTYWTSGIAQTKDMWYQLDLGETQTVGKVVLENPGKEFPRGLTVKISTGQQDLDAGGQGRPLLRRPGRGCPSRRCRRATSAWSRAATWSR